MYTIAGATGRVGSAAAERLLADGEQVQVLVRDPDKADEWSRRGAEVAAIELGDRDGLAKALDRSDGLFVLLPFNVATTDYHAETSRWAASIAGAVADSGVPHVAVLSSVGADLAEGTGLVLGLHDLEERLRTTGTVVTAIRSNHFQENVSDVIGLARDQGIYPVFGDSADKPKTMIATPDIGTTVAEALQSPPTRSEVIDLVGPTYTEREVADKLGTALGKSLEVVTIPRAGWVPALLEAGLSPDAARVLSEMYDADERGLLQPRGDRMVRCTTDLYTTLAALTG